MKHLFTLGAAAFLWVISIPLVAQITYPVNDVANPRQGYYAFTHATIVKDSKITLTDATLIIRQGKIEQVGVNIPIPKEAVVLDCQGKYIYPSFIDMYSDYGTPAIGGGTSNFRSPAQMLSNTKGPYSWNQALKSELAHVKIFQVNEAKAKELRQSGFGLVLTHQMDGISRGAGTIVSLANQKENLVILKEKASAHYSFSKGSSTQDYPTSLMGSVALLRQNFLDAQWYKSKPVKEGLNLSLSSFNEQLSLPQIFEVSDKWSALRADKIGDEFGIQYIIKAAGDEYQRIEDIKATKASFILPLAFPQAMDLEDPTDARFVNVAELKHWELAPTNPAAFEKAGIPFALTAHGLKETSSFLANLKKAIQMGLSEQKAMDALTTSPAQLLGIADQVGTLDVGKLANFLITTGPVFQDKTQIVENWVQGNGYGVQVDAWSNLTGKYAFQLGAEKYTLVVKADLKATLQGADTIQVDLSQKDQLVNLVFSKKGEAGKRIRLTGTQQGANWLGTGQLASGDWVSWKATREGALEESKSDKKEKKADEEALGSLVYPFNGFGQKIIPKQETILIKNTTVWTNEKQGVLKETDVLVKNGKIVSVGKNLKDASAKVIDGTNKHLTAGIIDEHSHVAAAGGINECSQSVTAEVRVADVIDPEDVDIYRQLSGGVTSSHILHGSCNTIGGQTQLIKFRWGQNAEQMKFANWDPFIKFALGENVKRSYNTANNRFPDTRMGVEQVLIDAFTRAREYEKLGPGKRIDLELETLLEILNKKRFITCHSYVQSEINSMMKVAESFNFTVNTFTHILEGYKVADKMKQHGANASTFSDWWNYKMEVLDAIPQNAYIMQKNGINVAINSDDAEMARRLNQEAAKSVKYAGMSEEDALKMVTLNPANMLHVSDRVGSIKAGKDADLVLWSAHPLSIYAKSEKTIVDGMIVFDRDLDATLQANLKAEKQRLVQKMANAKKGGASTRPAAPTFKELNNCEEDHQHDKSLWERIQSRMVLTEN
ncbi:amidohydrolase family protein [Aquirufa salirivi]|uniref:Amidohydrolase family protein n=1 Tax=Aquirufa salirivi TaxID=3104729 RepID=A0ABW8RTP4_9BACT